MRSYPFLDRRDTRDDNGTATENAHADLLDALLQRRLKGLEARVNKIHWQHMKAVQTNFEDRLLEVMGSLSERLSHIDLQMNSIVSYIHKNEIRSRERGNKGKEFKSTEPAKSLSQASSSVRVKLLDPSVFTSLESTAHNSSSEDSLTDTYSHHSRRSSSTLVCTPSIQEQEQPRQAHMQRSSAQFRHSLSSTLLTRRWGKLVLADRRSASSLNSAPASGPASAPTSAPPSRRATAHAGHSCDVVLYGESRTPPIFCTDAGEELAPASRHEPAGAPSHPPPAPSDTRSDEKAGGGHVRGSSSSASPARPRRGGRSPPQGPWRAPGSGRAERAGEGGRRSQRGSPKGGR